MKNSRKINPLTILLVIIMTLFLVFPFYWTVVTSLKPDSELYGLKVSFLPEEPTFESYSELLGRFNYLHYFRNSFMIAGITTVVTLTVSTMAAYAFSRYQFKGRRFFMCLFLTNNMFPSVLLLIPLFMIMRKLSILYTPWALVLAYSTFTIPFTVWMMTGFINDLPSSLEEAAMIDGATRFGAFWSVVIPMLWPCLIATGVYIFMTAWNEYTFANLFTNPSSRTIPVALRTLIGEMGADWGLMAAGAVVSIVPILIMFFLVQKRLISGLTAGAVKG